MQFDATCSTARINDCGNDQNRPEVYKVRPAICSLPCCVDPSRKSSSRTRSDSHQLQSFQVEGQQKREISLFLRNKIGRFFAGTFQGAS